jgi:hypothetical protein
MTDTMPTLIRKPDWALRLTEFFRESKQLGLKCDWEVTHCGGWAANAVEEMTGHDFLPQFGEITSPLSAHKAILKAGYENLEDAVRRNFPEKPAIYAQRGDLVFIRATDEVDPSLGMPYALGVADPPFYWALTAKGVGRGPITQAVAAFAVGANT